MLGTVELAAAAGSLAAVNPCGFAMLPAYLLLFLDENSGASDDRRAALRLVLRAAIAVTAGFLTVFVVVGVALAPIAASIQRWTPALSVLIGVAMVVAGLAIGMGRPVRLKFRGPQSAGARLSRGADVPAMYLYGISYAITSLGCALGPFLILVGASVRDGRLAAGMLACVAYAVGMGAVVMLAAAAVAAAGPAFRGLRWRGPGPLVTAIGVVAVGAYVAWYGVYQLRLRGGGPTNDPVIDTGESIQSRLAHAVDAAGPLGLLAILGGILALGGCIRRAAAGKH